MGSLLLNFSTKVFSNTFNIQNKGGTTKNPFSRWISGLQLGGENKVVTSVFSLIAWTLIETLILFSISLDKLSFAVNHW